HLLFSSLIPRPPTSPLFPYTTLFRSVGTTIQDMVLMRMETPYVVTVPESLGGPGNSAVATSFGIFQGIRACLKEVFGNPLPQGRDRKSTRLNSSHLVISYAVFCLKKK